MAHLDPWPALPLAAWQDTCATLHRWLQVVGKIRLVQTPWINHSWHVTLYPTVRGLTTSPMPYGTGTFQIDFDFFDHRLIVATSDGAVRTVALRPMAVADFYAAVFAALGELGIAVHIHPVPNELPDATPLDVDRVHAAYDPEYARRFWRVLAQSARVFTAFRARYLGKCSPVHFFWGSNDLAVTRFSGRTAPPHPGGVPHLPDVVAREAYSHEVSSAGFWPGGGAIDYPAYYSYAYPSPDGFADEPVQPGDAFWSKDLGEFVLPYDAVRTAADPDAVLLAFLQSTYEAAANRGGWDRAALERREGDGPPR
ncbi:MAG: hypothetical protein KIT14_10615 [bacterium]|nr:hypothetical protein [bacterium]